MARSVLCRNSSISDGASARLASMNCRISGNSSGSFSVDADDVAEQADLAVLELKAAHHLHAAEQQQLVDLRHQPAGFGGVEELGRLQHGAIGGAQPGERLVVADLALRQRDDRLQIEIDAAGIDRVADGLDHFVAAVGGGGGFGGAGAALRRLSADGRRAARAERPCRRRT